MDFTCPSTALTKTYSVFQMEANLQREVILRFRCVRRLRYLSFRALRWESLTTQCQQLGVGSTVRPPTPTRLPGLKPTIEPTGSHDGARPLAYAVVSGMADWSAAAAGRPPSGPSRHLLRRDWPRSRSQVAAIVALFVWRRERHTSFVRPHEHAAASNLRSKDVWTPEPKHLVPFGPYGAGQWTAHPIGLVIVIGLVLMGLSFSNPGE